MSPRRPLALVNSQKSKEIYKQMAAQAKQMQGGQSPKQGNSPGRGGTFDVETFLNQGTLASSEPPADLKRRKVITRSERETRFGSKKQHNPVRTR